VNKSTSSHSHDKNEGAGLTIGACFHSELAREKMWSRIHLIPLLQAEEDRDLVRRHLADQAREKELLGENIKVYNSDRCVHITFFLPHDTNEALLHRMERILTLSPIPAT
jgi:hypothetical protein